MNEESMSLSSNIQKQIDKKQINQKQVSEALNTYYKLKNNYESEFHYKYIRPILNTKKSIREKKALFHKLPKPKCVNCHRNVGSIFHIQADPKNWVHIYTAKCGDISDPCPLDIRITMPNVETYESLLSNTLLSTGTINQLKSKIIQAKNNLLFGYTKEAQAFEEFQILTEELTKDSTTYDYYLEQYITLFDNPVQTNLLNKEKTTLGISIENFKFLIKEFNNSKNVQMVHDAVEFYIHEMLPLLQKIQNRSYAYNSVENINNEYILIQKPILLEQMEIEYSSPKVDSFLLGVSNKTKPKTLKAKTISTPVSKTKKNKNAIEMIADSISAVLSTTENNGSEGQGQEEKEEGETSTAE